LAYQNEGFHEDVEYLVQRGLKVVPKPWGEDIIEDVFLVIEGSAALMENYSRLLKDREQRTVNQRIGHFTKVLTGFPVKKPSIAATRTTLTKTYSKLIPKP
jgi:hypothetical protein